MFDRVLAAIAVLLVLGAAHADEAPLRDPMQPYRPAQIAAAAGAAQPRYALTAVLISPARKIAVVNGRAYRQGERVSGAELVRIEPDAVHLREGNANIVIRLASTRAPARSSEGDTGQ